MDLKSLFGIETAPRTQVSPSAALTKTAVTPTIATAPTVVTAVPKTEGGQILVFPMPTSPASSMSTSSGAAQPGQSTSQPSLSTSAGSGAPSIGTNVSPNVGPIDQGRIPTETSSIPNNTPVVTVPSVPNTAPSPQETFVNTLPEEGLMPISLGARILAWYRSNKKKLLWGALAVAGVVVGVKAWKKFRK